MSDVLSCTHVEHSQKINDVAVHNTIYYTEEEYTQIVDNYRTLSLKTVKRVTTLLDTHLPN